MLWFAEGSPIKDDAIARQLGVEIAWRRERNDGGHVHSIRYSRAASIAIQNFDGISDFCGGIFLLQGRGQSIRIALRLGGWGTGLLRFVLCRSPLRHRSRWRRKHGHWISAGRDFRFRTSADERRTDIAHALAVGGERRLAP